jgi:hypothetical protein
VADDHLLDFHLDNCLALSSFGHNDFVLGCDRLWSTGTADDSLGLLETLQETSTLVHPFERHGSVLSLGG